MPMSLFQKIIDDGCENGFRQVTLHLWGEPLLDNLIFDRIAYVKEKGMSTTFTSNATLLTSDKIEAILESGLDVIRISIDGGTKESYASFREGGDFDKVCANIEQLIRMRGMRHSTKPFVHISTLVQPENPTISEELQHIYQIVDSYLLDFADSRRSKEFSFLRDFYSKVKGKRVYPCRSLWERIVVMSNGKVCLCCHMDYEGSVELGDLTKQTIKQIWDSKKFTEIRQLHLEGKAEKIELCRNCDILYRQYLDWWS